MQIPAHTRREVRQRLNRPVKLRMVDNNRSLTGQMRNISSRGMLVDVDPSPFVLSCGLKLLAGIAWNSQHMLLHSNHMVAATVVRCSTTDDKQCVAIQFDHQLERAQAA